MRRPLQFVPLLVLLVGYAIMPGTASSHREAPLIGNDPQADNTDLYAFVSSDAPDTVTTVFTAGPNRTMRASTGTSRGRRTIC